MSKYILILCISILIDFQLVASHIIGGDVTYECVFVDTINNRAELIVEFQLFRDGRFNPDERAAKSFDSMAFFGVYRRSGRFWEFVTKIGPMSITSPEEPVPLNDTKCLVRPPSLTMLRGVYRFDLTLDLINEDYMISYQRCCRGVGVSNIINASQEGSVFAIEITPEGLRSCNDPMQYQQFPPSVICAGFPFSYDHSAKDAEGDSIVYEICTPLSSGRFVEFPANDCEQVAPDPEGCGPDDFREVRFMSPFFSNEAPVAGDPAITVDPLSGIIAGTPNVLGELVMAVCATEYRDSVVLSRIRRDMQFVVVECDRDLEAIVAARKTLGDGTFDVISCGDNAVQFQSLSVNERFIDEYVWTFDLGDRVAVSNEKDPLVNFPGLGTYNAKLVLNPDAVVCTDSADIRVGIFPDIEADYEFDLDTCVAGPVDFTDLSQTGADRITSWAWDYGDGNTSRMRNPEHFFREPGLKEVELRVEDTNGCIDSLSQNFFYTPIPDRLAILPDFYITCTPGTITFDNVSEPIDSTYKVLWDFGDGTNGPESRELSPTHTYTEPGDYTIKLSVTSPSGCTATQTFNNFVEILDGFSLDFNYTPERPTILENDVRFTGQSEVPGDFLWTFGDGSVSMEESPLHTYKDTGLYRVQLTVTDATGCIDTLSKQIYIAPIVELIYPNAFTPDGDGANDLFMGVGAINLISNFELLIFDRWGKVIFKTNDPTKGWNGKLNNSGQLLPIGVYTYWSTYTVPRFGEIEKRGIATLIR